MSDELSQIESDYIAQLPATVIREDPYYVVEVALYRFLSDVFLRSFPSGSIRVNRDAVMDGLSQWFIFREDIVIAALRTEAISATETLIHSFKLADNDQEQDAYLTLSRVILDLFLIQLGNLNWDDIPRSRSGVTAKTSPISIISLVDSAVPIKRKPGAPQDPDNQWARAELALGRDRQEVFAGYLRRQLVNTNDQRAVNQARERFKKATISHRVRKKGK